MIYGNIFCEDFTANKLFDYSNPRNSDGLFTPYITLREKLLQSGIEINTPDVNAEKTVSLEIHMDSRPLAENDIDKYLIAVENPLINRLNADIDYLKRFRRVFSWSDAALALPGAVKILIPNNLVVSDFRGFADRTIFSCLISSNKVTPWGGVNDLYAERINVIRWYENNAPDLFHLYGRGWGKPSSVFTARDRFFRRIGRLRTQLFGYKPFPSWRGEVKFKSDILSDSRYSYCYENVKDLPNYITEKIFDSFLSGCVPVYWGADNVQEYIPPECFVDRRRFRDTAEVHRYLMGITPEQYGLFQKNIFDFLGSEKAYLFSTENFATTIATTIASDIVQNSRR
jgi:alpha(1,3/1,4) fucosyltransferase